MIGTLATRGWPMAFRRSCDVAQETFLEGNVIDADLEHSLRTARTCRHARLTLAQVITTPGSCDETSLAVLFSKAHHMGPKKMAKIFETAGVSSRQLVGELTADQRVSLFHALEPFPKED